MFHFIYSIKDKKTGEVGYIGITNNPNARMSQHLGGMRGNSKKDAWLRGIDPDMDILEIIKDGDIHGIYLREAYWIRQYIRQGAKLTNITLAGRISREEKIERTIRHLKKKYELRGRTWDPRMEENIRNPKEYKQPKGEMNDY